MSHHIAIDGIGFTVRARFGTNITTDVAAAVEDVSGFNGDGCHFPIEEAVTDLCIPDEFVGVHVG